VVDYALRRREVDRQRIAPIGVSQGGYWIARALACEHRIGAGVADPGVWNVGDAWVRNLPPFLLAMLGRRDSLPHAGDRSGIRAVLSGSVAAIIRDAAQPENAGRVQAQPGADLHCELNAPSYRDYRIYNWLDETLHN